MRAGCAILLGVQYYYGRETTEPPIAQGLRTLSRFRKLFVD